MSPQSARAEPTLADAAKSGGPEEVSKETMMGFISRARVLHVAREGYTTIIVTPEDVAFSSEEELKEEEEKMRQRIWWPAR
ncbi:hypothetical protein HBI80_190850 [Parastagonospora nodorum]|nr:hypothetical protein HBH47_081000 [Parastagonospora nodorum]KAH4897617.1 hypothetical protein HBI80_190850 [Parastagonospora nodorum]